MGQKSGTTKNRNLEKTRSHILDVAFWEIYTRGFQGVSVDDIVKKTSLTKGAFYHHFPTKLSLGYALVDEVIKPMIIDRWISPLSAYKNPIQGILKQLQKYIGDSPEHLQYGCPLNNLVQEMAPIDKGFKTRLEAGLDLWITEMEKHIKRGQKDGFISNELSARDISRFIVMSHEGFYGIIKGIHDPQMFSSLYKSLKIYFKSIESPK